jgi:hypothetical protein
MARSCTPRIELGGIVPVIAAPAGLKAIFADIMATGGQKGPATYIPAREESVHNACSCKALPQVSFIKRVKACSIYVEGLV